ncbi:DUF6538 domain-containing protein [Rhizobium sp. AP16]|uniref:DUF6538 domain-containing protein n=1 Tax=Rhizobium sp. AP16 TaxID=1144306 RepID=UPI00026EE6A9|nr:DUF6538 domain-containing protein [Rhizobium sp. AP16]EJK80618.1 prophage antirepressor [Rhizobium sp. AP16]
MVLQMPRPFKHPKTGVYYYRARVPADLVSTVGKTEVKISLQTKDPVLAKELFSSQEQKITARWKMMRAQPEPLTQKQIVALSGKVYRKIVEGFHDEPGPAEVWKGIRELAERVAAKGLWEQWYGQSIDELLISEGIATDGPSRDRLIQQVHQTLLLAADQQLKKAEGDYSPDPNVVRFPPIADKESKVGKITLTKLFERWERDHLANGGAPKTPADFLQKIEDFKAYLKHDDATRVTGLNVADYCEFLRHERRIAAKTVSTKYLTAIRVIYRVGLAKSLLTSDPTANIKVSVPKPVKERSKGFTDEEAVAILTCALSDPERLGRMTELNKLACRWVPWICAYTGARAGEITQLRRQDVSQQYGHPFLMVTPEAGSVKTGEYRMVPIHPHLVELGLLEWVASRPHGPLFYPELLSGTKAQSATIISRESLYKIAMHSDRPEAKHLWNWVARVVLPAIRRDDLPTVGAGHVVSGETSEDEVIFKAIEVMKRRMDRLAAEQEKAKAIIDGLLSCTTVSEYR